MPLFSLREEVLINGRKILRIDDLSALMIKALAITVMSVAVAAGFNHFRGTPLEWDWRPPPPTAPVIEDFVELQAALARSETVLVDAREDLFYEIGHIPSAVSLPLDSTDEETLAAWQKTVPQDAVIIIYCSDSLCPMADKLAQKMFPLGLSPSVFKPGFDQWELNELPVESGLGK